MGAQVNGTDWMSVVASGERNGEVTHRELVLVLV